MFGLFFCINGKDRCEKMHKWLEWAHIYVFRIVVHNKLVVSNVLFWYLSMGYF